MAPTPILPPEIVRMILWYSIESAQPSRGKLAIFDLVCVCHQFREIAMEMYLGTKKKDWSRIQRKMLLSTIRNHDGRAVAAHFVESLIPPVDDKEPFAAVIALGSISYAHSEVVSIIQTQYGRDLRVAERAAVLVMARLKAAKRELERHQQEQERFKLMRLANQARFHNSVYRPDTDNVNTTEGSGFGITDLLDDMHLD